MNADRSWIAILIVGLGGGAILITSLTAGFVMIFPPRGADGNIIASLVDNAKIVFNSVLPLLGTWVGAVVSYYFGKANFEVAALHSENIIERMGQKRDRIDQTSVQQAMVPFSKLTTAFESDKAELILEKLTTAQLDRLPVLKDNSKIPIAFLDIGDLRGQHGTIADVITMKLVSKDAFRLMPVNASLREAAGELNKDRQPKVSAIFVTQNGRKDEDLIGMLVAKDLSRFM